MYNSTAPSPGSRNPATSRYQTPPCATSSPDSLTGQPPEPPAIRLDRLLSIIASVHQGYAIFPSRSPRYLAALQAFHHRAMVLSQPRPKAIPTLSDDLDKLEKEWWASEIVAAWYGPRPGGTMPSQKAKSRTMEREMDRQRDSSLKRDMSHVVLYDDD
ncbi:MAG: hypothetical protein TREMPRED_005394 [Tremellales sp. Tagirdzhanova-0007]|nr:MAG: hypothetical protein TREMPRED_005394 [Tremellales sp. Tagirdzhanova-0007]